MRRNQTETNAKERGIYKVGFIAWLIGVAPRTVSKWFAQGDFPGGFRLYGHRYIPRAGLVAFLKKEGYWDDIPAVARHLMYLENFPTRSSNGDGNETNQGQKRETQLSST